MLQHSGLHPKLKTNPNSSCAKLLLATISYLEKPFELEYWIPILL